MADAAVLEKVDESKGGDANPPKSNANETTIKVEKPKKPEVDKKATVKKPEKKPEDNKKTKPKKPEDDKKATVKKPEDNKKTKPNKPVPKSIMDRRFSEEQLTGDGEWLNRFSKKVSQFDEQSCDSVDVIGVVTTSDKTRPVKCVAYKSFINEIAKDKTFNKKLQKLIKRMSAKDNGVTQEQGAKAVTVLVHQTTIEQGKEINNTGHSVEIMPGVALISDGKSYSCSSDDNKLNNKDIFVNHVEENITNLFGSLI